MNKEMIRVQRVLSEYNTILMFEVKLSLFSTLNLVNHSSYFFPFLVNFILGSEERIRFKSSYFCHNKILLIT